MDADPTPGTVLVRCGTQMLADMAGNGMSEPVVIIGIEPQGDGTYDLVMQRPSRAVLEATIRERFQTAARPVPHGRIGSLLDYPGYS